MGVSPHSPHVLQCEEVQADAPGSQWCLCWEQRDGGLIDLCVSAAALCPDCQIEAFKLTHVDHHMKLNSILHSRSFLHTDAETPFLFSNYLQPATEMGKRKYQETATTNHLQNQNM